MKVQIPPFKSQGIKSKLVPWIKDALPSSIKGRWIEPFMGTGVVGFNLAAQKALMCDSNPYLIKFYNELNEGTITGKIARDYLEKEGATLESRGEEHYYYIRDRFNEQKNVLDFLFLNRSGFNGMIRFNRKGGFNIPFCKKESRFSKSYVTKIVNQIDRISEILNEKEFEFKCQKFEDTIKESKAGDIIYCDPPYIARHSDYYNEWDENEENALFTALSNSKAMFMLSTWHHNKYRRNEYLESLWSEYNVLTKEHFYHVGGSQNNRNTMIEALVTNYTVPKEKLLENKAVLVE